jgi:hypothetical protein
VSTEARLANLHVARLRLGDFQRGHQMIGLHHLRQHGSGQNVLADLQREIHQHPIDPGSNFQGVQLLLFELRQRAHLIDFGLLLRHLRLNGFR